MSRLKKILAGLAILLLLVVVIGGVGLWWIGAWGIVFPSDSYETEAPELTADFGEGATLRVAIYTKTNSFRHTEGISASHALFDEIGAKQGWAVFHTENSALFTPELLNQFDVIVFASASGNHASDAQDEAFRAWLEAGGGWLGIHAAGDGSHELWDWYAENLMTGTYLGHILGPQTQAARVIVEATSHPITRGLPTEFQHEEEWYSWDRGAREAGFDVLLTVDESSYSPWIKAFGNEVDIRMTDHPIVWSRCVGRGRAVYSAMGHWGDAYAQDYMQRLLENAVVWASGVEGKSCGGRS